VEKKSLASFFCGVAGVPRRSTDFRLRRSTAIRVLELREVSLEDFQTIFDLVGRLRQKWS
jgi:hypothetical protein